MVPDEHLLARFFVATKRERYAEMISKPKKRTKFLAELDHFKSLDPRCVVPIMPSAQNPDQIAMILARKGAPSLCWITSSMKELDGQQQPLLDALKKIVGRQMGTFLTCIPGVLAYYEGEDMGPRYILERRKNRQLRTDH